MDIKIGDFSLKYFEHKLAGLAQQRAEAADQAAHWFAKCQESEAEKGVLAARLVQVEDELRELKDKEEAKPQVAVEHRRTGPEIVRPD